MGQLTAAKQPVDGRTRDAQLVLEILGGEVGQGTLRQTWWTGGPGGTLRSVGHTPHFLSRGVWRCPSFPGRDGRHPAIPNVYRYLIWCSMTIPETSFNGKTSYYSVGNRLLMEEHLGE